MLVGAGGGGSSGRALGESGSVRWRTSKTLSNSEIVAVAGLHSGVNSPLSSTRSRSRNCSTSARGRGGDRLEKITEFANQVWCLPYWWGAVYRGAVYSESLVRLSRGGEWLRWRLS